MPALLERTTTLGSFAGVTLRELDGLAALQRRRDNKYLIDPDVGAALLADLAARGDRRALEVDGRRTFRYESVYFDTEDLALYRAAVQQRRRRAKVRIRRYVDSGLVFLEVKVHDRRSGQRKHRTRLESRTTSLDSSMRTFVDQFVGEVGLARTLRPTAMTSYLRSTLLHDATATRATFDTDLACFDLRPRATTTPAPAVALPAMVVESKSGAGPTLLDHDLWDRGVRPIEFSKYCTGLAALDDGLPSNRWHRTLRNHFAHA